MSEESMLEEDVQKDCATRGNRVRGGGSTYRMGWMVHLIDRLGVGKWRSLGCLTVIGIEIWIWMSPPSIIGILMFTVEEENVGSSEWGGVQYHNAKKALYPAKMPSLLRAL